MFAGPTAFIPAKSDSLALLAKTACHKSFSKCIFLDFNNQIPQNDTRPYTIGVILAEILSGILFFKVRASTHVG